MLCRTERDSGEQNAEKQNIWWFGSGRGLEGMPPEHHVDGIHLSQEGNRWVAERFADAIEARR